MMDWFDMINKTTQYIEDHITEDMILEDIAKACHVSYYYFTKTFALITGYTLKEYIRNRRITLASYEVSNTDHKLLDIAIRYGYGSNESFSRAFKKIHGINPSEARKNEIMIYTHFPVINYNVPKQNFLSINYDKVKDMSYDLVGQFISVDEEGLSLKEALQIQFDFIDDFKRKYPSNQTLYKVHFHLSEDFSKYDYFVGYDVRCYEKKDGFINLNIKAPKLVRFISLNIDKDVIYEVMKIIYYEWGKTWFDSDRQYEIEFIKERPKGKLDLYYMITIE